MEQLPKKFSRKEFESQFFGIFNKKYWKKDVY